MLARSSLLLVLLVASLALAAPARASAPAPAQAALPPQGLYEQCGPAVNGLGHCLRRLRRIRRAGFTYVLNYMSWFASADQVRAYASEADRLGVHLIWPYNDHRWRDGGSLRRAYPVLARDCRCHTNRGFMRFALLLVRGRRATWGHYIADELSAPERERVARLGAEIRRLDPRHPQLIVSFENAASAGSNLRPFADLADVVAADSYPVGTPDQLETVGSVAQAVQSIADQAGKRSALVLQAFSFRNYGGPAAASPWPTYEEMRRMRDLALVGARPEFVLWYSFQDMLRSNTPRGYFGALRDAAFAPRGG